ncbi:MAG TPA: winged helix-turn-helix domain-containing protein [Jatrophihabitantaceae bacterium]|jgi:DNA-binding transcriptional ArsR family regulator
MSGDSSVRLTAVHTALADPLRIRLYELLVGRAQSAKELAGQVGVRADRLYHHLNQLEHGKLIEVAEYRRLPRGKVERVYAPAAVEPTGDEPTPAHIAVLLNAALAITRADVNAATAAQEAGEQRRVALGRTVLHVNERHLNELTAAIEKLLTTARDHPDDDGVWTTVLWTTIDRQDRRAARRPARRPRSRATNRPADKEHQP